MPLQDLAAEQAEWVAKAEAAGPGYRVWRWEEYLDAPPFLIWRHRLLAPDEDLPDEPGVVLYP